MLLTKTQLIDYNLMSNSNINIDYDSFEVITNQYAKDKKNIYLIDYIKEDYYKISKLDFDIESFEIVANDCIKVTDWPGHLYTKDKNGIYYLGEKIKNIDTQSFQRFKNRFRIRKFYNDEKNLICDGKVVKGINPINFRIISESYAIDDKYVYYIPTLTAIKGSDPNTFKVNNIYSGEDKYNYYEKDKSVKSKRESFFNKLWKKYNRLFV